MFMKFYSIFFGLFLLQWSILHWSRVGLLLSANVCIIAGTSTERTSQHQEHSLQETPPSCFSTTQSWKCSDVSVFEDIFSLLFRRDILSNVEVASCFSVAAALQSTFCHRCWVFGCGKGERKGFGIVTDRFGSKHRRLKSANVNRQIIFYRFQPFLQTFVYVWTVGPYSCSTLPWSLPVKYLQGSLLGIKLIEFVTPNSLCELECVVSHERGELSGHVA